MIFIHPEFLWGLLALSIPIIIHLFDFRKNKKVFFSDIRFLKEVKHSSRKPLKLKQLLILLSRLGFVFFLVAVFAQPIIPTESRKQLQTGPKLFYIDNSQSMSSLANSQESSFEKAKSIANLIINKLPKEQEVIIINNDNLIQIFEPKTSKEASNEVLKIKLSDKPFSLDQLGTAMSNYAAMGTNLSNVFLLSDFQKFTLPTELNMLDTTLSYWLTPIERENTSNCIVDSVYLVDSNISTDGNIKIEVVIVNNGDEVKENLPIKVFVGTRQVSASSITIPAYQSKKIEFSLGKNYSTESGYILIEDYPNTFDNTFYFSLPQKKYLSVFEIVQPNSSDYIKTVFGNSNLFTLATNNFLNVDISLFNKADFVVLNQIEKPSIELIQQLKLFAENGGNILVIPDSNFDVDIYKNLNPFIEKLSFYQKQKLLPPNSNSPFFSNVLEKSTRMMEMPSIGSVWSWGKDNSAILSFEDGSPYLSEVSNNTYFISAPLIDSISNFQSHALFVPVMYQLASQSSSPTSKLFSRVRDEYYGIELDSVDFNDLIKLSKDEMQIIPSKIRMGNKWRLMLPQEIVETGNYTIEIDDEIKGHLSINLNREESLLKQLDTSELENLFSGYKAHILDTYYSNLNILTSFDTGIALWKYALTICLVFLLIETLLIRFL